MHEHKQAHTSTRKSVTGNSCWSWQGLIICCRLLYAATLSKQTSLLCCSKQCYIVQYCLARFVWCWTLNPDCRSEKRNDKSDSRERLRWGSGVGRGMTWNVMTSRWVGVISHKWYLCLFQAFTVLKTNLGWNPSFDLTYFMDAFVTK